MAPGSGHYIQFDRPDVFLKSVKYVITTARSQAHLAVTRERHYAVLAHNELGTFHAKTAHGVMAYGVILPSSSLTARTQAARCENRASSSMRRANRCQLCGG